MKSRANFNGHPLHPILVSFPIAFFTGTLIFDLSGWIFHRDLHQIVLYLEAAGLLSALVAAIPGLIDFIYTVPPQTQLKKEELSMA